MQSKPVFFDPEGRRGASVSRLIFSLLVTITVLATVFLLTTIFVAPFLPSKSGHSPSHLLPVANSNNRHSSYYAGQRNSLELAIKRLQRANARKGALRSTAHVVAGFYAPWQETGYSSFQKCVGNLTHVLPEWLHLSTDGYHLDFINYLDMADIPTYQENVNVARLARQNGVRVMPILSNGVNGVFDPGRAGYLLHHPKAQLALATETARWLIEQGYQGVNIDLENLHPGDYALMPELLRVFRKSFQPLKLDLSIDIEAEVDKVPARQIAQQVDFVVLMDYDEHSESDPPGPIASFDWANEQLEHALKEIPANKLVLGIGNYAYDWALDSGHRADAESLTFQEALANAKGYHAANQDPSEVVNFDPASLNETFTYSDDNNTLHRVWMLSGLSAYNQWLSAQDLGLRGAAVWALGQEDPSIWTFLDRRHLSDPMDSEKLEEVHFPRAIDYQGKGEILKVVATPTAGSRTITKDTDGIIVDARYHKYPLPYVIQQSGYRDPKALVLTFDDGPDPTWTPLILDELKKLNVPAAFFLIGKNAENNPGLVQRIVDDGDEVGNHTFFHPNIGLVPDWRARLEIDTTQRAIESITGRGTILFRPPYNADSEPTSDVELKPVILASDLSYLTVGEKIDPTDWDLTVRLPNGRTRAKTAEDIVSDTIQQITDFAQKHEEGNVILLHDAGGPRPETVRALPILVHELQRRGFHFVRIADLIGRSRDYVMPPISARDRITIFIDRVFFGSLFGFLWLLSICFVGAIALGISRVVLMTPLALIHVRRINGLPDRPEYAPAVTALIAAYNEESVIVRTVDSILSSKYPIQELVVVDDGSKDGTAAVLAASYGSDPRVRLISQPNSGKATALNNAMSFATGEILFCVDADTQLDPDAVGKLVRHFSDSTIGAVAGNVRVGNVRNLITLWQSIEYTTSQNVDRHAYALLNAVTVVPGAIGAWRKSAVERAGGYLPDTLAEDMDLTWRLRRAGYRLESDSGAIAYTEAPDTFRSFFRQRFRWTYGTLQCLWKHRDATFRYGWFGRLALPTLWLFQILFQVIAPLVDLQILISLLVFLFNRQLFPGAEVTDTGATEALHNLKQVGFLYALFFGIELGAATIAYKMDRQPVWRLWWLFLQRFIYRQILYTVAWKSFLHAMSGTRQGWGKLERKGTVTMPANERN